MKIWIHRNGRAVVIIVLMIVLIGITITRPAWQDNIGFLRPKQTVPYGHSIDLGGVRWQLTSINPPNHRELQSEAFLPDESDQFPPNTRLVTYVIRRDEHGKPGGLPTGFDLCRPVFVAGDRQWQSLTLPLSVEFWGDRLGYTTICGRGHKEPLLVARVIPDDVHISSIDIQFLPVAWENVKQLSKNTDLLVIRFNVG
jgi:hypothetical protein